MKNTRKASKKNNEELWESRKLGANEKFVRKVSVAEEKAIDDGLGLQSISIRLQKSLIDDLKMLASKDGIGYQPYVRQLLTQHVRSLKSGHKESKRHG